MYDHGRLCTTAMSLKGNFTFSGSDKRTLEEQLFDILGMYGRII
jgi:hypothetical protein